MPSIINKNTDDLSIKIFRAFSAGLFLILAIFFLASYPAYAQLDSSAALSELEPSDDYRPDGYYEPYDFSFVKTSPASEEPPPTKYPLPPEAYGEQPFTGEQQPGVTGQEPAGPPPGGYDDPQLGPDGPPMQPPDGMDAIAVPEPPDFNSLIVSPRPGQPDSVVTDFSSVQNPFNEPGAASDAGSSHPQTVNVVSEKKPSQALTAGGGEPLKLFLRRGKKPVRFKLTNANLSANIENIISGRGLAESNWNELHDGLLSIYAGAVANTLGAEPLDEEFERINSVLMTYMLSYGAPDFDSVIIKYKNYYFAFLGPLAGVSSASDFKPSNPEAKYKLLRLLGGDIIKIISGNTIMFSLKPLSFCVSDIMREVANGEFYKLEVLFRVMTSADAPVRNLVRPFFQLLKSKILSARDLEKAPELRNNYSKAYELLNKIK
jgi:hypothetical protein